MMQTQPFEKHVWAEIDLEALRHNFRAVKARAGALPLCAVVKADSYGHGAVQCARVFAEEGAAWLAVSCLTEAVQLRKGGLTLPILVLGHVQPGYAAALIQNHITVACYSAAQAKALSDAAVAAGGRVQIHLKADTGMGRIGFALRTDFDAALAGMLLSLLSPWLTIVCVLCGMAFSYLQLGALLQYVTGRSEQQLFLPKTACILLSLLLTLLLHLLIGGGLMGNVMNYMIQLLSNVGSLL